MGRRLLCDRQRQARGSRDAAARRLQRVHGPELAFQRQETTDLKKALPFLQAASGSSAVKHILHEKFHLPVVIL